MNNNFYGKQFKPYEELLVGLENWCKVFNSFAVAFFLYMKYIFAFISISVGLLTLLKFRGMYRMERTTIASDDAKSDNPFKNPRIIVGSFYIMMGLGFILNFSIYFLIIILDPLPDRFIFDFINFSGKINAKTLNRIGDLEKAKYPHEKTIYYCIAMGSFCAILDVVISVAYIINSAGQNHRKIISQMMAGVILGMFMGWTTCLPLFL